MDFEKKRATHKARRHAIPPERSILPLMDEHADELAAHFAEEDQKFAKNK